MDNNSANELIELVINTLKPILMSIAGVATVSVPLMVKSFGNKITKSFEAKNELEQMEKINNMKTSLMQQIGVVVKASVASNMQIAKKMKEQGGKLSDEQIAELNNSAKKLTMDSLPESLTKEGGSLNSIIGGNNRLDNIIDGMLEQYVYEYKITDKTNTSNRK